MRLLRQQLIKSAQQSQNSNSYSILRIKLSLKYQTLNNLSESTDSTTKSSLHKSTDSE